MSGLPEGLVVVVKKDCPTCELVVPALRQIVDGPGITIVSQDDPAWPDALEVVDDTALDVSWALQTETTPTVYLVRDGQVAAAAEGWHRGRWEELTGVDDLAPGLPDHRPGCGSRIFEPGIHERLERRHSGSRLTARLVELGQAEDEFEAMYARGWSDGLPLVPPTPERVERMLAGTTRDPAEVVAMLAPDLVECTVEKVAVNAVMAGCLPEYLPVVLAGVEAVASDSFNIHGVAATTFFSGPVLVVNGPIRERIGMNWGMGALGPGNRANTTIGRAVNLVVRNVGGSVPGGVDRSSLGSPSKLTMCFPEDESEGSWEPLSIERGFEVGESTVTAFAGHGPIEISDQRSRTADSLARSFAWKLQGVWHHKLVGRYDALVVIPPDHLRVFQEAGWSKQRLRDELLELTTHPGSELVRGAGGLDEGIVPAQAEGDVAKFGPDSIWFVRSGGAAGGFSALISGWTNGPRGSQMTTVRIES